MEIVALALPPGEHFLEELDAAWSAGHAVLPLEPRSPAAVRRAILDALRPHRLLDATGWSTLDAHAPPAPAGTALVIATSGSTGVPKGALLSHAALAASAAGTAERLGQTTADHWLACLPFAHIGGLQVALRARQAGTRLTILPRFDVPQVAAALPQATLTSLVPTTLARLLEAGVDLSGLRAVLLGGAAAPAALLEQARDAGVRIVVTYGMSETAGGCVYDGLPLPGVSVRLAADARVELSGPVLASGYRLNAPETAATFVGGWLRTADLGSFDTAGRLVVHGRVDDVIVTGGEKVFAGAVEEALAGHPGIDDVAVIARPDRHWGERIVAVVVPANPTAPPSLGELRAYVADRAGQAAAPRELLLLAELPRLTSGKVDRVRLRGGAAPPRAPAPGAPGPGAVS